MALDAQTFNVSLDRWFSKQKASHDVAIRALALRLFENIIRATPVDTGWARANWWPSIGERIVPPNAGVDRPGGQMKGGASAVVKAVALVFNGKAGNVFWLQNGVPYIIALEHGSSKQAPAGMVTSSVASMAGWLEHYGTHNPGKG